MRTTAFSSLCVSLPLILTASSGRAAPFLEAKGQVVIEAEHFEKRTTEQGGGGHHYVIVPDEDPGVGGPFSNARGGKFMQVIPETGQSKNADASVVGKDPHLDYTVQITTTGEYQLYLRTIGYSGGADSVYAQILEIASPAWYRFSPDPNGTDFSSLYNDNSDPTTAIGWNGYAGPELNSGDDGEVPAVWTISKAGTYTIRLSQREDGNAIDAMILQLSSLPPQKDPGPPESATINVVAAPKFSAPALQGANLVLTWSGTGALQSADAVTGTWADVANAKSPLTVKLSGNAKFYRVKQ